MDKNQIEYDQRWSDKGGRRIADINNTSQTSVFRTGTWNINTTLGWYPGCDCYRLEIIEDQPSKEKNETQEEYQKRLESWYERWYALKAIYDEQTTVPCTVLDPFVGSGTTLLVARRLGRNAVGLDLSYPYLHDQARKRLGLDKLKKWTENV